MATANSSLEDIRRIIQPKTYASVDLGLVYAVSKYCEDFERGRA